MAGSFAIAARPRCGMGPGHCISVYRTSRDLTMPHRPKTFRPANPVPRPKRMTATAMGYDYKWSCYSKRYRRENPLCVKCGRVGQLVDHIKPVHSQDDPLF